MRLTPALSAIARLNLARADGEGASFAAAEFTEAVTGLALRPVDDGRLNALARFTYFEDLGPVGQAVGQGFGDPARAAPKQVSTIAAIDLDYRLTGRLTLGGKYGYREGRVSLGRASDAFLSSDAHLGIVRADWQAWNKWAVLGEYRSLWLSRSGERQAGVLGMVSRDIGQHVRVGVGYSLARFSDDLTDQVDDSRGPFVNILGRI